MVTTSLSKDKASALVTRLLQLPAQSKEDFDVKPADIRSTLVDAIRTFARDDAHVARAGRVLLDECQFRPVWATVREAFQRTYEIPRRAECTQCENGGWITEWWLQRLVNGKWAKIHTIDDCDQEKAHALIEQLPVGQDIVSYARRCSCNPSKVAA